MVGEAGSAEEALEQARRLKPDLVLLDLALGHSDGLDLIPRIKRASGDARILVLSMFDETLYAARCLKAGAHGYIMKEAASERLVDAVHTVAAGDIHTSQAVKQRLVRRAAGDVEDGSIQDLTDRELQVFRMIGEGRSTREVAESLGLSVKTIETHRAKLMRKLGVDQASQLVHRAVAWVQDEQGMP